MLRHSLNSTSTSTGSVVDPLVAHASAHGGACATLTAALTRSCTSVGPLARRTVLVGALVAHLGFASACSEAHGSLGGASPDIESAEGGASAGRATQGEHPKTWGHVAIVQSVDLASSAVLTIEQNYADGALHPRRLFVDANGNYSMKDAVGWMHPAESAPSCLTGSASPALPSALGPDAQAFTDTSDVSFQWTPASGVSAPHSIRVRRVESDAVVFEQEVTPATETVTRFAEPGTYRWTVYYRDPACPNGYCSSSTRSFTVTAVGQGPCSAAADGDACGNVGVCVAGQCLDDSSESTLEAIFRAVARRGHARVPPCLLMAIGSVESQWDQDATSADGGRGLMQITGSERIESLARRLGVLPDDLTDETPRGAYWNIRAAELLLGDWAATTLNGVHLLGPDEPREAIESWWFPVVAYNGGGRDGSYNSSNYPYRVYNQFLNPHRVSIPVLDIDLASFPPGRSSRAATAAEIEGYECVPADNALTPALSAAACQIREFDGFDAATPASLHTCDDEPQPPVDDPPPPPVDPPATGGTSSTCGSSCSECILDASPDILENYGLWGWDTSCAERDAIVRDWGGIAPTASYVLRRDTCSHVCSQWNAADCGNRCTQCVFGQRADLVPAYAESGWTISCANLDAITNDWCTKLGPAECAELKASAVCSSVCP